MSLFLKYQAAFLPIVSAINGAAGIAVELSQPLRLLSITYSFYDQSGIFSPNANRLTARVIAVEGLYGDDMNLLSPTTLLSGYRVLFDHTMGDLGPTTLLLPPTASDGIAVEGGRGLSVVLCSPVVNVSGTQFIARLSATSTGGIVGVSAPIQSGQSAASSTGETSDFRIGPPAP